MRTIGVVTGICTEHDAISSAAAGQLELLRSMPDVDRVVLFTTHFDRTDVLAEVVVVRDGWQLLRNPTFAECDAWVFHWGIFTPLFDAVWALDPARVAVHFHNVTPPEFAPPEVRAVLHASQLQIEAAATLPLTVWTYSEFNLRSLIDIGVPATRIEQVPFAVEPPRPLQPRRSNGPIRLLSVGRLVPAKGVLVLVEAVASLDSSVPTWELVIAGNEAMSDPDYMRDIRRTIDDAGLDDRVSIVHPDDDALWRLFESSHVFVSPSFHEGLCVPVIEAYHAGCRVVASDGGNLRYIVQPPDPVVPAGDAAALAAAIADVCHDIAARGMAEPGPGVTSLLDFFSSASVSRRLGAALSQLHP